jgi:sigma-E factor negative regulatory protein RseB
MKFQFRWIFPLLLAAFIMPVASARAVDNNAEAWLSRMNSALRTLNYEGTFVYIHDSHVETMQITHRADLQGGIERMTSLTGPEREVVRDHKEVKCVLPESHSVLIERRYAAAHFPAAIPKTLNTQDLIAHYRIKDLGEDRVAGHQCEIIGIAPRDRYRYGYRLWLDVRTAMLLRSDLITQDGQIVERVMFTTVRYPTKIPNSALEATEIKPGYTWNIQGGSERPASEDARITWRAAQLPPGFVLSLNDVQRLAGTPHPVRHWVFSDGLASVSVFSEIAVPGSNDLIGPSRMGAVNAFGLRMGGQNVTIVGEVPPATVELIAKSILLRPQS